MARLFLCLALSLFLHVADAGRIRSHDHGVHVSDFDSSSDSVSDEHGNNVIDSMQCGRHGYGVNKNHSYTLHKTTQLNVTKKTRNGKCLDWTMTFTDGVQIQEVPVTLRHYIRNGANLPASANCFGFATNQVGTGKGSPGGNTGPVGMPDLVNEENLKLAMEMDGAIYLGRDPTEVLLPLPIDPSKTYFVTIGVLKHEEFHFWGLMTTGWVATPSKVGAIETYRKAPGFSHGDCEPSASDRTSCCPSQGIFSKITKSGVGAPYRLDEGGFWLYPVNECVKP